MSAADTPALTDRLAAVLAPSLTALGLDLEAVEIAKAGKHSMLRVAVDKDGGVDMDDIADATRAVSAELDETDLMGNNPYTLEVSSPGVDRPLTLPRHWRRNVGRLVQVRAGDRQLTGRVMKADDDGVVLSVDGTDHEFPYGELGSGKIQLEFSRAEAVSDDDLAPIDGAEDYDDVDSDDDFEEDEE